MIIKHLIQLNSKYSRLRLRKTVLDKRKRTVTYTFSYPTDLTHDEKKQIQTVCIKLTPSSFDVAIEYCLDVFDEKSALEAVNQQIKEDYPMLWAKDDKSIAVTVSPQNEMFVMVKVDEVTADSLQKMQFVEMMTNYFESISTVVFVFKLVSFKSQTDIDELWAKSDERIEFRISEEISKPKRYVKLSDSMKYIGREITTEPRYISDITKPLSAVTVCGKMTKIKTFESQKTTSLICKFDLEDYTGKIPVVYFAKKDSRDKFLLLTDGQEALVFGAVEMSSYSGQLELKAFALSKCKIAPEDEQPKFCLPVPLSYNRILPEKYVSFEQMRLGEKEKLTCDYLLNNDIVVFDFETTGLKVLQDRICEIGAVKIHNGKIYETFTTLVNPEMKISAEASKVSHITDDMVSDSPTFAQVAGDFFKFCDGSILVGHNVEFDLGFLKYNSTPIGYVYNNSILDTIELSQKFFAKRPSGLKHPSNYKLVTVANSFGLQYEELHRGLNDAMLTAKLLLAMFERDPKLM